MTGPIVRRHPVRGLLAGLPLGLGVALLLFVYGVMPATAAVLALFVAVGAVGGVGLAYAVPPRHRGAVHG